MNFMVVIEVEGRQFEFEEPAHDERMATAMALMDVMDVADEDARPIVREVYPLSVFPINLGHFVDGDDGGHYEQQSFTFH